MKYYNKNIWVSFSRLYQWTLCDLINFVACSQEEYCIWSQISSDHLVNSMSTLPGKGGIVLLYWENQEAFWEPFLIKLTNVISKPFFICQSFFVLHFISNHIEAAVLFSVVRYTAECVLLHGKNLVLYY